MIRFLKDSMSSISSDLYEGILKPNKSHTNRIIQIVLCKTAFTKASSNQGFIAGKNRCKKVSPHIKTLF